MSKLENYINTNFSFTEEYKRIFGKEAPTGKMFCPFHENKNTPAAKIYGNFLQCFGTCQKRYSVYDLLRIFDPESVKKINETILLEEREQIVSKVISVTKIDRSKGLVDFYRNIITNWNV